MSHSSGITASPELVEEFSRAKEGKDVRFLKAQIEDKHIVVTARGDVSGDEKSGGLELRGHVLVSGYDSRVGDREAVADVTFGEDASEGQPLSSSPLSHPPPLAGEQRPCSHRRVQVLRACGEVSHVRRRQDGLVGLQVQRQQGRLHASRAQQREYRARACAAGGEDRAANRRRLTTLQGDFQSVKERLFSSPEPKFLLFSHTAGELESDVLVPELRNFSWLRAGHYCLRALLPRRSEGLLSPCRRREAD
eukprot:764814-Hanusia_phi.AAC.1